jgi:hypothetical protein
MYQHTTINMDRDDGFIINGGIHKGKWQCKKVLLRRRTCDGGAGVILDQSARWGTYDNGVGIIEAQALNFVTLASVSVRTAGRDASKARYICWRWWQGDRDMAVAAVGIWQLRQWGEGKGTMTPDQHRQGEGYAMVPSP